MKKKLLALALALFLLLPLTADVADWAQMYAGMQLSSEVDYPFFGIGLEGSLVQARTGLGFFNHIDYSIDFTYPSLPNYFTYGTGVSYTIDGSPLFLSVAGFPTFMLNIFKGDETYRFGIGASATIGYGFGKNMAIVSNCGFNYILYDSRRSGIASDKVYTASLSIGLAYGFQDDAPLEIIRY